MSDWTGYALSDFLMFGPDVYWRLFALHTRALWPLPLLAMAAGLSILLLAATGRERNVLAGLSAALGWAGAAHFLATRYAPINWPMDYAAWAFAVQAALIVVLSVSSRLASARPATGLPRQTGMALLSYAVLVHPFVGLAFGRPLSQAEIFGLAPDPTALATLGLLLLLGRGIWTAALALVPLAWCAASAVTLLTLAEPQGWLLIAAPALWALARSVQSITDQQRR